MCPALRGPPPTPAHAPGSDPSSLTGVTGRSSTTRIGQRVRRVSLAITLACTAAVLISACGTSGRTLQDPAPGATAPPRKTSSTTIANVVTVDPAGAQLRPTGYSLSSPAWSDGGPIPAQFGCRGADVSPPLSIVGVPEGTAELLLIASDTASASEPRWIVADIDPATSGFDQGAVPTGAVEVVNSTGSARWAGPCPDAPTTTFQLRLYALSRPSGLTAASTTSEIQPVIATTTAVAVLRGTATR